MLTPLLVIHCRRFAIAPSFAIAPRCPSITVKSPSCHPSLSLTIALAVNCHRSRAVLRRPLPSSCCRAVPRRRGACAPSIAVAPRRPSLSRRQPLPYIAIHCRQSIHYCQVAVAPSIAVHYPSPLRCHCAVHCCPLHRAIFCHRIANAPSTIHCGPASITVALSIAATLSIAVRPSISVAPSISDCCLLTFWYGTTV